MPRFKLTYVSLTTSKWLRFIFEVKPFNHRLRELFPILTSLDSFLCVNLFSRIAALTRNCNAKCGFSTTSAFNASICDDATAVGGAGSFGVLLLLLDDELLLESPSLFPDIDPVSACLI